MLAEGFKLDTELSTTVTTTADLLSTTLPPQNYTTLPPQNYMKLPLQNYTTLPPQKHTNGISTLMLGLLGSNASTPPIEINSHQPNLSEDPSSATIISAIFDVIDDVIVNDVTANVTNVSHFTNMTANITTTSSNQSIFGFGDNIADNNDVSTDPTLSPMFMASYFGMRLLFSLFAFSGNLLTMIAVARYERLQNTTNFLICSLATADMLGACLSPLNIAHYFLADKPAFIPLCLIDKTISVISVGGNLFSILWIAIDRYLYIAHPFKYTNWVTRTKCFIVISLTWVFVVAEVTTVFVLFHQLKAGMTCKFAVFMSHMAYTMILMPQTGVYFGLTVICYAAIGRIAARQGREIAAMNQPYDTYEAALNRQQKKIAKMMATVLGTYLICYIPQSVQNLLYNQVMLSVIVRNYTTIFWLQAEKITVIIYWANTWLNPLIYAWKSEDFRIAFRKLLGMKPDNSVGPTFLPEPSPQS